MRFNTHSIEGRHSFLSPSKYSWLRYDEEKLDRVYLAHMAARLGTRKHAFASEAILLGEKLPDLPKTLNMYVNDAINYRMTPEQPLYYSEFSFGTADAMSFRKDLLRVHDLKTGVLETKFDQLDIYSALFCLEYGFKPVDIGFELRIYQNDDVRIREADPDDIMHVMDKIITFDKRIREIRSEVGD